MSEAWSGEQWRLRDGEARRQKGMEGGRIRRKRREEGRDACLQDGSTKDWRRERLSARIRRRGSEQRDRDNNRTYKKTEQSKAHTDTQPDKQADRKIYAGGLKGVWWAISHESIGSLGSYPVSP